VGEAGGETRARRWSGRRDACSEREPDDVRRARGDASAHFLKLGFRKLTLVVHAA